MLLSILKIICLVFMFIYFYRRGYKAGTADAIDNAFKELDIKLKVG